MDITQLRNKVVAVDFDNTITLLSRYPVTGKIDVKAIPVIKTLQEQGNKIILWTCREGEELEEAIMLCKAYGLTFDRINENIDGTYTRKIKADLYVDDKAVFPWWKEK